GRCLEDVDVAVLAGGLGTRIRPVLGETPKLLAPIAGRSFVEHLFDRLASHGARRIVLCLGHGADRIRQHVAACPRPFDVTASVETAPLGTAGALRLARPALRSDPVLVLNGDSWVEAD